MKKLVLVLMMSLIVSGCGKNEATKPVSDKNDTLIRLDVNGQVSEFDAVSGATKGKNDGVKYTGEEKDKRMKWSGRPAVGIVEGDYYYDAFSFDGGYIASVAITKNPADNKIISVKFDEMAPGNYYDSAWQNQTKRTSGYANWQMENERTSISLVTIVNAMTYLENQVIESNSVSSDFKSPSGASNSVNNGFIPLLKQIEPKLNQKSSQSIISITRDFGSGLFGCMQVVYDKATGVIVDYHYDEYFADEKSEIEDSALKNYYRQSKYQSPSYLKEVDPKFKTNVDTYRTSVINNEKLLESDKFSIGFNELVAEINQYNNK